MEAILRAAPGSMTRLNPDVPPELERIAFKCLEKSAEDRYQSARELLTDLWPMKRQLDATRAMVDAPWFEFLRGPVERVVMNDKLEELRRESLLTELHQRIRDVRQGPDGLLYVITDEDDGALLRIEPTQ